MTYEPITRSGIQVLAKDEDILCLGKRDQLQGGEEQDWGYLVPRGELERRYDSVKALEPQGKDQIAREGGNMRGSARA